MKSEIPNPVAQINTECAGELVDILFRGKTTRPYILYDGVAFALNKKGGMMHCSISDPDEDVDDGLDAFISSLEDDIDVNESRRMS